MLPWSLEQIATLRAAIASGVMSVTYSGPPSRSVTYQSVDAMREVLRDMLADNAMFENGRVGFRRTSYSKGV